MNGTVSAACQNQIGGRPSLSGNIPGVPGALRRPEDNPGKGRLNGVGKGCQHTPIPTASGRRVGYDDDGIE
jgi:hypothetical protein